MVSASVIAEALASTTSSTGPGSLLSATQGHKENKGSNNRNVNTAAQAQCEGKACCYDRTQMSSSAMQATSQDQ